MKIVAIIQARMGSTRLPGKVMKPLVGTPMIHHVVERMRRVASVDEVVVATSILPSEEALITYLESQSIPIFRGDEQDVLARYYEAAKAYEANVVVRITADCPLLSPQVSERTIQAFLSAGEACQYASNTMTRTYPRGLDTEVFSFEALAQAFEEATAPADREHVTPYLWCNPARFHVHEVVAEQDNSHLRWTVDEPSDYALVQQIYEALYPDQPDFEYEDVLDLLEEHPDWQVINAHIQQKPVL